MNRLMFGGMLALVLLAIYVGGVFDAVYDLVLACRGGTCTSLAEGEAGTRETIVTAIGALISAVVVAALATSDPGKPVLQRQIEETAPGSQGVVRAAVTIYMLAWLVTGLSALVVACLVYPDTDRFLTDIGLTWFGTAIAAGYAFFGLKAPSGGNRDQT